MWLLVAFAAAREPEPVCPGRLYEGTLLEVGEALGVPGVTLRATNPRKRERLTLCTDPTPTAAAVMGWLTGAGLLGYCVAFDGERETPCERDRTVWVGLDLLARTDLATAFDTGSVHVKGQLATRGGRTASVTLFAP